NHAVSRTAVTIDPHLYVTAAGQGGEHARAFEIVPLLLIEDGQKFGILDAVHLALHLSHTRHQPGISAEVHEAAPDLAHLHEVRAPGEHGVQRVALHEGAVDEDETRPLAGRQEGDSAALRTAARKSFSGRAPS